MAEQEQVGVFEDIERTAAESPFVAKFQAFFETQLSKDIEELAAEFPQKRSLIVDFKKLEHYDFELADELIENPDQLIEAAESAVQNISIPALHVEEFKPHVRFYNLPKDRMPLLRDVGSEHIGKLISVEGVIRQMTDILPRIKTAAWQCRRCGNVYRVEQEGDRRKMPMICECKHKDFLLLLDQSTYVNVQKIEIQEPLEMLKGSEQATTLNIHVLDDFVNKVLPGDRTRITGILRIVTPKEGKVIFHRYLEAVFLEETAKEFEEVEIKKEEIEEIKELAKSPKIYEMLVKSIAPNIYGHETVKEAIILQLFGGVKKVLPNDTTIRGNAHVLLVGDPGTAKSSLLQAVDKIAPKSIYVAGKTSTGVGLCVAPDTLVLNDSGFKPIKEFVEENFAGEGKEELPGCWSSHYARKCHTLGEDLKLREGTISKVWRIRAPEKMCRIKSRLGKELDLTPNTSLIRIKNGSLGWVKAKELEKGDFIACARALPPNKENRRIYAIELLKRNKNIKIWNNVSKEFKEITDALVKKGVYNDLTELAKAVGKSRDTVYSWRIPRHYHGIPLKTFTLLAEKAGWSIERISCCIDTVFIYHGKNVKIPQTIGSSDVAYLAGILLGDGSIFLTEKSAQIRMYNNSQEVLDEFDRILLETFGIKTEKYVQKGVHVRRASSVIVYEILKAFGLSCKKLENQLSHALTEARDKILNSALSGLFDTDGYVSEAGSQHIGISTISKRLAQTIQLSLLKSGIVAKLRERKKAGEIAKGKGIVVHSRHNQYYVEMRGIENTRRFEEKIGFKVKRKQEALRRINSVKASNPNLDLVPELGKAMHLKGIEWGYKSGKRAPSRRKLAEIAKKTRDPKLKVLAESDVIWEEIVEKEEFNPEYNYVYDFTVEETHNFIANGFIAHNTASAVKDDFGEGGWTLKAGALVLASGGMAMVDEFDKMDDEDRGAMHEAMEQGMISVAKAGIVTRFRTDTSILAAANPKFSRFEQYQNFLEQINLPPTLVSRFDLFFMMRDVLDRRKDEEIASHILKSHQAGEMLRQGKRIEKESVTSITPVIPKETLKKYISFARQNVFPALSKEAIQAISDYYLNLREQGRKEGAYTATHRQLEGLVRLAEASARVRLSDEVERQDAERAIALLRYSLQELVTDRETGRIDIDLITTGQTQSQQDNLRKVLNIVKSICRETDAAPKEQVFEEAEMMGIDIGKAENLVRQLVSKGELYEPKHGFLKPAQRD